MNYEVVFSSFPPFGPPTDWSGEVFCVSRDDRWTVGTITGSPSKEGLVKAAKEMARADRFQRDRIVTLQLDLDDEPESEDGSGPMGF